jgi:chromosome segregation protein
MKGFKSFPAETDIPFEKTMNIIVGPNGSGKSNVADAICFVLGRLSIKSIRAERSANLIFAGTKVHKPSSEASVEIIFDNSEKSFNIDKNEISIKRTVRRNGQSIYKINNDVKTRQEILELLAGVGIDPNGFNIILQGEISSFVKMQSEERRGIIEEVAGISVYEIRKEKSLKELEKTDEKLKEITAILKERTDYLKNLDQERQEALKFKQLEELQKKCRASLLHKDLKEKEKETSSVNEEIEKRKKEIVKLNEEIYDFDKKTKELTEHISSIDNYIQKSSGIEQENLHKEISDIRAELAGMEVRRESYQNRLEEIRKRRENLNKSISTYEEEIKHLRKKSPEFAAKQDEINKKRVELKNLEELKEKYLSYKSDLNSIKNEIEIKRRQLKKINANSDNLTTQIEQTSLNLLNYTEADLTEGIKKFEAEILEKEKKISEIEKNEVEIQKKTGSSEAEIERLRKLVENITKLDICPVCQSKMTQEHVSKIKFESNDKIKEITSNLRKMAEHLSTEIKEREELKKEINELKERISKYKIEKVRVETVNEKKQSLKKLVDEEAEIKKEIRELEKSRINIERKISEYSEVEEKHSTISFEIEQISARTEENVDIEVVFKERELEKIKVIVKKIDKDEEELEEEINELLNSIDENNEILETKTKKEKEIVEKFEKHLHEKNEIQKQIHELDTKKLNLQHEIRIKDNDLNEIKVSRARIDAEKESVGRDYKEFEGIEILNLSKDKLIERLAKTEDSLSRIGSVNMRALEVYDDVKKDYDSVLERTQQIEKEKEHIMKIIHEIDVKKKKTFKRTFDAINVLFTRNFRQLNPKGDVFLEIENKEDPFAGGVGIVIKVGKGKYFDVTSLSGGEQTLAALSLIFAIQEYKPYSFYILDEIDAALDKRNSERLAGLIKQYMKTGQYIIVTHNDALISEAQRIYGVSMQDGISKILSLEI